MYRTQNIAENPYPPQAPAIWNPILYIFKSYRNYAKIFMVGIGTYLKFFALKLFTEVNHLSDILTHKRDF